MGLSAKAVETVVLDLEDFPRVAVNTLFSLSYKNELYDEIDKRIIFFDPQTESYGADTWRCHYQVVLTWKDAGGGEIAFEVRVKEKNYGDAHIDACVERAGLIVEALVKASARARECEKPVPPWTAKYADEKDLLDEGFILQDDSPKGQAPVTGGLLIGKFEGKKLWLPPRLAVRHTLVCGPTGSGKSTSIFIPNLIEQVGASAIVTEASAGRTMPVLYKNSAGWRNLAGQKIIYFNPDDERSMRVNPIDLVQTFDDAQLLANLIVSNTTADTHVGDQIWSQAETHLLQSLLLHVAGLREDLKQPSKIGDNANLGYLRALLRLGPKGMQGPLRQSKLPAARNEYEAYLNNSSPNFRFGVVSGLLARLTLFANPQIAAVTEVTDFSMDDLTDSLFTMYLSIPVHRQDYTPLAALVFNYAFTFLLNRLEKLKYPLMLFLDEFTNFGAIAGMSRYLTVIRNAGIGAVLGVQDVMQMELVYRDKVAQILWSQPRTKIFYAPADDRMAERISRMMGTMTDKETVAVSGQLSAKESPRPLIAASDLMFLERENKYVALSTTHPVKLDRLRSWIDYSDPIRREPPIIPKIKVVSDQINDLVRPQTQDVCESIDDTDEAEVTLERDDKPLESSSEIFEKRTEGSPSPESSSPTITENSEEDFWSGLNRKFSTTSD